MATSDREQKLQSLGFPLDRTPPVGAIYRHVVIDGNTVYTSGAVPMDDTTLVGKGKVPSEVSLDDAKRHAALCAANILRNVRKAVGSLDRIERVLKTVGYVNSDPAFGDQHLVVNGASELLRDVLGDDAGIGVRTAIGMAGLPLNSSVEVDVIFKLKG
jgi:enamine deaminase RidA (YjgF/YER057c/UK114 family)